MPASFKMDPLLAKASPVSSSGSTSGIAELRKVGRTGNSHLQLEREVRMHDRKNPADIKVSDKGEGADAPTIKEIPLQPVVQTKLVSCRALIILNHLLDLVQDIHEQVKPDAALQMCQIGGFNDPLSADYNPVNRVSESFKQKLDSVPDQTSTEEQMENWSKETHILDQKKEDFCAKLQFYKNSQKPTEFFIQAETEALECSDLPVTCQRGGVLTDCNSGSEESSMVERKDNRMLPEFISSWNDAEELGGKTETAFLLKELDTLRAKNKKLQDKLAEKDKELKTMKLDLELQERATEAKIAEKIAALVEEVYSAQRERDEAVMARLRLANEERDEAFLRVQRLEESLKELENINPEENDMTLQELLNRINNADTGIDILKNGAIILNRIHRTKERKKKIIAEEMNAVIEQRDAALSQCKRLEQELHHLKEQNQTSANNTRHMTAENNQERALKVLSIKSDRIMTGPRKGFLSPTQSLVFVELLKSHSGRSSGRSSHLHIPKTFKLVLNQFSLMLSLRTFGMKSSSVPAKLLDDTELGVVFNMTWRYYKYKAELIALQQEKEAALQQCKRLEEEIQTLRVYYRLYKSLSEGMSLKSQPNCAFSTSEGGPQGREDAVTLTYGQIEELAAQLQQTRSEKKDTELKLQKALEASQEANEKVQKFYDQGDKCLKNQSMRNEATGVGVPMKGSQINIDQTSCARRGGAVCAGQVTKGKKRSGQKGREESVRPIGLIMLPFLRTQRAIYYPKSFPILVSGYREQITINLLLHKLNKMSF
ncbi:hypothetical protein TURU_158906 [Turdus rufiventris]|nr:hypothetical protein TURU_158906 [Turdus rufiventris]